MSEQSGDRRAGFDEFKEMFSTSMTAITEFRAELENHTDNNKTQMDKVLTGQEAGFKAITELKEAQIASSVKTEIVCDVIKEDLKDIKKTVYGQSRTIAQLEEADKSAKSQRKDQFESIKEHAEDISKLQQHFANGKDAKTHQSGLLSSKYIQASLSVGFIIMVIGIFQLMGVDPAKSTGDLIHPTKQVKK